MPAATKQQLLGYSDPLILFLLKQEYGRVLYATEQLSFLKHTHTIVHVRSSGINSEF